MIQEMRHLGYGDQRIFERATIKAPFRLLASMPNEACFYYVRQGQTKVIGPTSQSTLQAKEGVVVRCGHYLTDFLTDSGFEQCEAVVVHFYPELLRMIYDQELPDFLTKVKALKPAPLEKVKAHALLKNYIDSLEFYFDNPDLVSHELIRLKLKELILLLAKTDNAKQIHQLLQSLFTPQNLELKAVIEANLFEDLTQEELAALCGTSLSTFKREFQRIFGTSCAAYIRKRRLEKAAQLLKATDLRVSDVAYDCGFKDVSHFSKTFQKAYSYTPTQYRLNQSDQSLS